VWLRLLITSSQYNLGCVVFF